MRKIKHLRIRKGETREELALRAAKTLITSDSENFVRFTSKWGAVTLTIGEAEEIVRGELEAVRRGFLIPLHEALAATVGKKDLFVKTVGTIVVFYEQVYEKRMKPLEKILASL